MFAGSYIPFFYISVLNTFILIQDFIHFSLKKNVQYTKIKIFLIDMERIKLHSM